MITSVVSISSAMAGSPAPVSGPRLVGESSQAGQAPGGGVQLSPAELKQIVGQMQDQLDSMNISLQFSVYGHNDDKVAVKVVDRDTGKVIREIPPKEIQALQVKMSELVGMIFDRKT
ncbi:MAG TPA: flagellar protein FlaG [Desulfomonilaceae bacterium]|nr:flagellar protein FlaG [Desulfomonilaceae bacterium]